MPLRQSDQLLEHAAAGPVAPAAVAIPGADDLLLAEVQAAAGAETPAHAASRVIVPLSVRGYRRRLCRAVPRWVLPRSGDRTLSWP